MQFPNLVFDHILLTDGVSSTTSGAVQRPREVTCVHPLPFIKAESCSNVTVT